MSDYRDYFVDGPGIDPGLRPSYYRYNRQKRTYVLNLRMNAVQREKYRAIGGAPALKRLLDAAPMPVPLLKEGAT